MTLLPATILLLVAASSFADAAEPASVGNLFLYAWAGPEYPSKHNKDFLATINATDPFHPKVIAATDINSWGNEPHHVGVNGNVLAAGGLFSYRRIPTVKPQPTNDIYFFDTTNGGSQSAAEPTYTGHSLRGVRGAVVDSFLTLGPNAMLVTMMGNRKGRGPGKLGVLVRNATGQPWRLVNEFDGGLNGTVDATFLPHGMDRFNNTLVTADYVDAESTWASGKSPLNPVYGKTVRVWDIEKLVQNPSTGVPFVKTVWDVTAVTQQPSNGQMSVRYSQRVRRSCQSRIQSRVLQPACDLCFGTQLNRFYFSAGRGQLYTVDTSVPHGAWFCHTLTAWQQHALHSLGLHHQLTEPSMQVSRALSCSTCAACTTLPCDHPFADAQPCACVAADWVPGRPARFLGSVSGTHSAAVRVVVDHAPWCARHLRATCKVRASYEHAPAAAGSPVSQAIKEVYRLDNQEVLGSCVMSPIFRLQTPEGDKFRMVVTSLGLNQIRLLDITDIDAARTLSMKQMPAGSQPHVVVTDSTYRIAAVSTYYVEQTKETFGRMGIWSAPAEKAVRFFGIEGDLYNT
ncbi:hypothetical protein QJQ45_017096 [Haematococcus lacustris]|nr:hypothetical protein QJQ45_017096 [Haematococcus lacustris]